MGTNLFTLHSCGSCGLPIEKTYLCSVPVLGWFCMNTLKIGSQELFL